jgi:hypothetical protein
VIGIAAPGVPDSTIVVVVIGWLSPPRRESMRGGCGRPGRRGPRHLALTG